MLASDGSTTLLVDATRDLDEQLSGISDIDAVVLTHGHRDASGGVPALRMRLSGTVRVYASPQTIKVLRGRYAELGHIEPVEVEPGADVPAGSWTLRAVEVPHANRPRFRTYAWRLTTTGSSVVYASDVGELTADLENLSAGADLLILDGAMYRRSIFSHLRIEQAVPIVCGWRVGRILLTQIGRSAPPHEELAAVVQSLCSRAVPAYDGLVVEL